MRGLRHQHDFAVVVVLHHPNRALISMLSRLLDDREAPAHRRGAEVLLEIRVRQHLENEVHALTARELHNLVEVAGRGMVEDVMGVQAAPKRWS